tara:strand:+ start:1336 stop:1554 length:219 start_codon:yes stop_codon:yes gene_type:complete
MSNRKGTYYEIDRLSNRVRKLEKEMKTIKMKKMDDKIKNVFDKMDKETQEAVKSLIDHLMVAKTKKEHKIDE